ncbi:MAG: hypothetical protein LBB24_03210 [Rickettsiales bacterium]|jgi:hypothetical protein|nr:hypothetical protein [Rickettsiales bacterium]
MKVKFSTLLISTVLLQISNPVGSALASGIVKNTSFIGAEQKPDNSGSKNSTTTSTTSTTSTVSNTGGEQRLGTGNYIRLFGLSEGFYDLLDAMYFPFSE